MIINEESNGKTIEVPLNQEIELKLPGNPTTGHQWMGPVLDASQNPAAVEVTVKIFEATLPMKVGSGGTFTCGLRVSRPGTYTLGFFYKRPWEKDTVKDFRVTLQVA